MRENSDISAGGLILMGEREFNSVKIKEKGSKGVTKKHLTKAQIREIQEAINEFFQEEKEKFLRERDDPFQEVESQDAQHSGDDGSLEEE